MTGDGLVSLSAAAAAQLGAGEGAPVRVRRVNPPEAERAELRAGRVAPDRMETPKSLVQVLRRKLPAAGAVSLAAAQRKPVRDEPPVAAAETPEDHHSAAPAPAPASAQVAKGAFVIQAAAFANRANANRAARQLGGFISPSGTLFRVRTGPFLTRGQADAALAKVRAAGYSDARVTTAN
jgi:rare lipoprotein A